MEKTTHVDAKLPRIHQRLPMRNLEVEVVDERLEDDAGVELEGREESVQVREGRK